MGTRADLYVGRGEQAEWLGSIAWDGDWIPESISQAKTESGYRTAVTEFLASRDDGTVPSDGWPWPWDDSHTTDYAYAFDDGQTWAAIFGDCWYPARDKPPEYEGKRNECVFPNMKARKKVTYGKRSGVIILGG
jgi:hypothetical protein